jgi:integrase
MTTRYSVKGKIETPISDEEFFSKLGRNQKKIGVKKTGFVAFLFYFGVRVTEALKMKPKNFTSKGNTLFVNIGKRLKHSKETPPLTVLLKRPFVSEIVKSVERTRANRRIWKFTRMTAYRLLRDTGFNYPHYMRLNRVTDLFSKGYSIDQIKSWTGLSLGALNYYVGIVNTREIGKNI